MSDTTPTPEQESKPVTKKLNRLGQNIKHGIQHIHKKIGVYGWTSLALLILLVATVLHYEARDFRRVHRFVPRPMYMRMDDNWIGDIDRDFQNMQRQMDTMRTRHERMMREAWGAPIDPAATTSIVSNGDYQYSVNTRSGKLDGFVSTSDATKASTLIAQIKGLGLTIEQKDSKLFFNGDAQKMNELLKILGK